MNGGNEDEDETEETVSRCSVVYEECTRPTTPEIGSRRLPSLLFLSPSQLSGEEELTKGLLEGDWILGFPFYLGCGCG